MTDEQMAAWLRSYAKFAVYLSDKERINAMADRIEALCRAIEQHEADKAAHAATIEGILKAHKAFKQEVSDAVEHCRACSDPEAWTRIKFELDRFIIAKPDPLVAALGELADRNMEAEQAAETLREALANRGLKIVETER